MKKRILLPNGKFVPYKGNFEKVKIKSEGEKIAERKDLEETAKNSGFAPVNPVLGGLSVEDKKLVATGKMSLRDLLTLSITRKVIVPEDLVTVESVADFLLGSDKKEEGANLTPAMIEQLEAGISIPEMRKMAKDNGVSIPGDKKKALDIKAYLLTKGKEEEEEEIEL